MATFNPADKKNALLVLSNGNLTATSSDASGNNWVRSNLNRSGKRYCEIKIDTYAASHGIGIADASALTYPGANAQSFCLFGNGFGSLNNTFPDWGGGGSYNTFTTGSTVGMAVDLTAKKLWYRINGGNWNGSVLNDPATGTGGLDISAYAGTTHYVVVSGGAGFVSTANFGETAFQVAAPSGFLAWNAETTTLASVPTMTASTKTVQAGVFATCVISGLNIGMTIKGAAAGAPAQVIVTFLNFGSHTNLVVGMLGSPGDLLVFVAFIQATGTPPTITPPAGWTQFFTPISTSDGASGGKLYAWYRVRLESDGNQTFTHTVANSAYVYAAYSNVNATPIDVITQSSGTGTSTAISPLTTVKHALEQILFVTNDWSTSTNVRTPPAGLTERVDDILYYAETTTTTLPQTVTATMTNANSAGQPWAGALISLAPGGVTVNTTKTVSQTLTSPAMTISAGNATIPGQTIRLDTTFDVMEIYHSNVAVQAGLSFTQTSPPMTASTQDVSVITNDILSINSPPLTIDTGGVTAIAFFPAEADIDSVPSIKARFGFVDVSIPIVVNATGEFMLASVGSVVGAIKPIINITAMPAMTASTQTVAVVGKANVLVAGDWGTAQAGNVTVIGKANVALASVPAMTSSTGGVTVKASQIVSVSSPAMTSSAGDVTPIVPPGAGSWNHDRIGGPGALINSDRTLVSVPSLSPATCFSTVAHGAGTFYAEVTIGGSPAGYVGLYNEASNAGTEIVLATGEVRQLPSGALTPTFAPIHSGDIIGIAYDGTDGEVWFRVNGGLWNNDASQGPVA